MTKTYSNPSRNTTDLTGLVFDRLTVKALLGVYKKHLYWDCLCSCGKRTEVRGDSLKAGIIKSCGCLRDEQNRVANLKHGFGRSKKDRHPMYNTWSCMIQRCTNPKATGYDYYGGMGIKITPAWLIFDNFKTDMESSWAPGLTLERKEVNEDYGPSNCIWLPRSEQMNNTRRTYSFPYRGKNVSMSELAEYAGITHASMKSRLEYHNITIDEAVNFIPYKHEKLNNPRDLSQWKKYYANSAI